MALCIAAPPHSTPMDPLATTTLTANAANEVGANIRKAGVWKSVREPSEDEFSDDDDEDRKGRGKYRCGRCGAPKAGHNCPLESRSVRRSVARCRQVLGEFPVTERGDPLSSDHVRIHARFCLLSRPPPGHIPLRAPALVDPLRSVEVQASPSSTLFLNRTVHTISVRHSSAR